MSGFLGRGLFWRLYATLFASLILAAFLAGLGWHLVVQPGLSGVCGAAGPPCPGLHMRGGQAGRHMLLMLLTIAIAVGLVAFPVVSRLTRRLEALKTSLDAWGEGRLNVRAKVQGRDEIAVVAESFNAAADRVESLLAAHRTLLAHASHELRSPLARLGMAVEMYADAPRPDLRQQIVSDIAELADLVDEILLASRLDQGRIDPLDEEVDCLEIAAEEAARAAVSVRREGPADGSLAVVGSPRLLRRLIRNLIDNALRHGAPPVDVEVSRQATPAGSVVVITVADHGAGLSAAERERIFEPFYRPRGRAEVDGGWGLGLSIARQIAERHGGTVSCAPGPAGGARFEVRLPAAA